MICPLCRATVHGYPVPPGSCQCSRERMVSEFRDLIDRASAVRTLQRDYFRTRSPDALTTSKLAEWVLDARLKALSEAPTAPEPPGPKQEAFLVIDRDDSRDRLGAEIQQNRQDGP